MGKFVLDLESKPHTKDEAWHFLQMYSPQLTCSIRQLATAFKWHRCRVERFIKSLKSESLIETKIESGKTIIRITNGYGYRSSELRHLKNNMLCVETKIETGFKTEFETDSKNVMVEDSNSRQNQDNYRDISEIEINETNSDFNEQKNLLFETMFQEKQDSFDEASSYKEEKKKRSKKRKEEIKEKPPLKGGKKEKKISANEVSLFADEAKADNALSSYLVDLDENYVLKEILAEQPKKKPIVSNIATQDVIDWAEKSLPANVDIGWELDKFQDYIVYSNKKLPKDLVAAFRNWFRRASESSNSINKKTNKFGGFNNDHSNHKTNKRSINVATQTTGFERFLTGGIRALDRFKRGGLDGEID